MRLDRHHTLSSIERNEQRAHRGLKTESFEKPRLNVHLKREVEIKHYQFVYRKE
jgi:hypothetical protein